MPAEHADGAIASGIGETRRLFGRGRDLGESLSTSREVISKRNHAVLAREAIGTGLCKEIAKEFP